MADKVEQLKKFNELVSKYNEKRDHIIRLESIKNDGKQLQDTINKSKQIKL